MKSVKQEANDLPFPKLMRGRNTGNIYLMFSEQEGTCVYSATNKELGKNYTNFNPANMEDYSGLILLQN